MNITEKSQNNFDHCSLNITSARSPKLAIKGRRTATTAERVIVQSPTKPSNNPQKPNVT